MIQDSVATAKLIFSTTQKIITIVEKLHSGVLPPFVIASTTRTSALRWTPCFRLRHRPKDEPMALPYTAKHVAEFLGEVTEKSPGNYQANNLVKMCFRILELNEKGFLGADFIAQLERGGPGLGTVALWKKLKKQKRRGPRSRSESDAAFLRRLTKKYSKATA